MKCAHAWRPPSLPSTGQTSQRRGRSRATSAARPLPLSCTSRPKVRLNMRVTRREPSPHPRKKRKMATKVMRKLNGSELELGVSGGGFDVPPVCVEEEFAAALVLALDLSAPAVAEASLEVWDVWKAMPVIVVGRPWAARGSECEHQTQDNQSLEGKRGRLWSCGCRGRGQKKAWVHEKTGKGDRQGPHPYLLDAGPELTRRAKNTEPAHDPRSHVLSASESP